MGILSRLERRSGSFHPSDPFAATVFGSAQSNAGQLVTADSSLGTMAVYRAVRLLSQTLAKLPLIVYEKQANGTSREAPEHPLSKLLRRPNPYQTAFEFTEMLAGHVELRGNGYAEVIEDGRGRATALIPLHPDRLRPMRGSVTANGQDTIWYKYTPLLGGVHRIESAQMLHIRGFSVDGLVGISPISAARETIGLAQASEEQAARFFSNNSEPGGVLSHPKALDEQAKKRLKKSWEEAHRGAGNSNRVAVLEEGLTWQTIGVSNKDAQFLENRKFQVIEIARMFDLPPHKLMDMSGSTFSNTEQLAIEFVTDAIQPRAVRWEQAVERDCLLPSDDPRYCVRFQLDELLRGDSAARSTYYREMWGIGAFSTNEIRQKENANPVDGGDERFVPLNMVPLSKAGDLPLPPLGSAPSPAAGGPGGSSVADPSAQANDQRAARAKALRTRFAIVHRQLVVDAVTRAIKREAASARAAARSDAPFATWIDGFYPGHEGFVLRALRPAIELAGDALAAAAANEVGTDPDTLVPTTVLGRGLRELLANLTALAARAHVATSRRDLRDAGLPGVALDAVALEARLVAWEADRSEHAATAEINAIMAAVVGYVYRAAGLTPPADLLLDPSFRSAHDPIDHAA